MNHFSDFKVPFHKATSVKTQQNFVVEALNYNYLSGEGRFNQLCSKWLNSHFGVVYSTLTPSCTAALEMALVVAGVGPGDEVIMPSFTFPSTATAAVLLGATPVFVDCRIDTFNLDEQQIEAAITKKTKVILPVHYAGVSCDMKTICAIAQEHKLIIIEDAAQAIGSRYAGKPVGTMGHISAFSFHHTKNICCGEGGAFILNDSKLKEKAEIARDKGTNRSLFIRGEVDKYSWYDRGSSYLLGDLSAALLYSQLIELEDITLRRLKNWNYYHEKLRSLEERGAFCRPVVPTDCEHNAHIYGIFTRTYEERQELFAYFKSKGILPASHYIPLHSAAGGMRYGRAIGDMSNTDRASQQILRLPMFDDITEEQIDSVVESLESFFKESKK